MPRGTTAIIQLTTLVARSCEVNGFPYPTGNSHYTSQRSYADLKTLLYFLSDMLTAIPNYALFSVKFIYVNLYRPIALLLARDNNN